MAEATVLVEGRPDPLAIRINGARPTFQLATDALEAKALRELDPVVLDLLDIAASVFAADGAVPRGGQARSHMGARWYRRFDFSIPVRLPDLWQRHDVVAALTEAVETLTEDSVNFAFTPAGPDPIKQPFFDFDPDGASFGADEVVLFSGGLDSFAGALELLATTMKRIVLVTHRSAQKAITRQVKLGEYLAGRYSHRVLHVHVVARRTGGAAVDSNQRSRTLLFAALGQAAAQAFGARRVSFFENGVVSHNLPLSPQIVGTMATRTTHPLALRMIDRFIGLALPSSAPLENRYQWHTKSEVVSRIAQNGGASQIPLAVSCTSIRQQDTLRTHCGACSQCFDRRFAILHAGLAEHDPDEIYAIDVLFGERTERTSKTMAAEWPRHMLHLGQLDETALMREFGLEVARILRGHPETPQRTTLEMTLQLHRRQAEVVRSVLETVLRDRAADFVNRRISDNSLFMLHLGAGDGRVGEVPRYAQEPARQVVPAGEPVDEKPLDPDAPLRVRFSMEGKRHVVDVIGISSLIGELARVPHVLKPTYDEDRDNWLAPDEHRYTGNLSKLLEVSKDAARKSVQRCRTQLHTDYELVLGTPPSDHLLIQNHRARGYRLDPHIVVVSPNQE